MKLIVLIVVIAITEETYAGRFTPLKATRYPIPTDAGEPLLLTPLIEAGQIEEAQNQARVNYKDFDPIKSYSGYLTVDSVHENNLFFWYFPSENDAENDPVVLWLQGGPGSPSEFGLFEENGPFKVNAEHNVSLREYRWTKNHSMLYIDNPVGTGFSFSNNNGYARNQTKVGEDMYNGLIQFFKLFPYLQDNDFFVTGESYAGKYVPAVTCTIFKNNPAADLKINLQGLAIGNGLTDPVNQGGYGYYVYQLGLVDAKVRDMLLHNWDLMKSYVAEENWALATQYFDDEMIGLISDISEIDSVYNYIQVGSSEGEYWRYLIQINARSALHVGNIEFESGPVAEYLHDDISKSVAPWVSELLSNYRVLIYSGQVDIIVGYPMTVNYLQNLNFSAAEEYKTAQRKVWRDSDGVAGYYKVAGNLTELLVRNAGHMVPSDQPKRAHSMIYSFTRNLPYQ